MSRDQPQLPDSVPMLSRGRHRNPRRGACFMEFASYLAGERWSDHPACTHPLVAALARHVNDWTSNAGRQHLATLVPSVIGRTSDDPRVDARIALRTAGSALPVAAAERQRVLAVAIHICDRALAELDGRPTAPLSDQAREALALVPLAAEWATTHARSTPVSMAYFRRDIAPSVVRYAIEGIAWACITEPDLLLRRVLVDGIAECQPAPAARPIRWTPARAG